MGTPLVVPRSESAMKLTIRAPGFVSREIEVVPSENRTFRVQLERAAASVSPDLEY